MTNTRKTTAPADEAASPDTAPAVQVFGPPLLHGQIPQKVTFAHHLRIDNRDFRPGDTAHVSPDYARQLRRNGYIARG